MSSTIRPIKPGNGSTLVPTHYQVGVQAIADQLLILEAIEAFRNGGPQEYREVMDENASIYWEQGVVDDQMCWVATIVTCFSTQRLHFPQPTIQ